jgi:hypothetical protein
MGTWNAFYVCTNDDQSVSMIRASFPAAEIARGAKFAGFTLTRDEYEPPAEKLAKLSSDLGADVIWLSFQSTCDSFQFHHWRAGAVLRALVFGCYKEQGMWDTAEGQPEPWERTAFFTPRELLNWREEAENDAEKHELDRIWREGEVAPGRVVPCIDARESARAVAEHYEFPGWE